MLFELGGRRKRFIQVIYVFLALLLGGGLVVFGIGGDAAGGLGDAIGLNSNQGGGSSGSNFENEIEAAEERLQSDPEDADALLNLARYQYLAGQANLELDDQGRELLTDDAVDAYEASVEAWERYLGANKGKPDDSVARLVVQAYSNVAFARQDPVLIQRTLDGAVETATVVAESGTPNPNSYLQLATLAYYAGDTKAADAAAKEAVALVEDEASRESLQAQLDAAKRDGRQVQAQLESGSGSESEDFSNPFGGLGGDSGG